MATAITLPASGVVNVTTHISSETGLTSGTYAGITAALTYNAGSGDVTIATLGSATYAESGTAGVGTLTWSGDVGNSALEISKGATVKLVITNTVASSSFQIDYDSSSKPSRIDLPVANVIDIVDVDGVDTNNDGDTLDTGEGAGTVAGVQEIGFFGKSSSVGGSSQITAGSIDAGGTVYIRVKVKDPFGAYDINSLKLSIDGPGTTGDIGTATPVDATVVGAPANGDTYKTFEYAWQTVNNTGEYTVTVTAAEGFEGTVTDVATGSFTVTAKDLGTPSITQFITALSGSDAGATYAQGANAFLRVTDLDEASATAGKTITATVNGTSFTLTQTGANTGIFEAALTGAGFTNLPQGTVLTASYTDPDDGTDISTDSITVPVPANTAPTATANARSINENQTASGTNLITTSEGSGTDSDAQSATASLRVTAINGAGISQTSDSTITSVTLPSGALLQVSPDGNYTYNQQGSFNYLGSGQSATDTFSYTIRDGGGLTSTATVTITINGLEDPSVTVTDSNGTTLGDNTIAENATSPVTGTFTLSAPAGLGSITVNGTSVTAAQLAATPVAITTSEGTITLTAYNAGTGTVAYSYQQTGTAKSHASGDTSVVDSIPLTITDSAGTTVTAESIDVLITDTAPTANADADSATEDGTTTATGNVITAAVIGVTNDVNTTDGVADSLGADTATVTGVQAGTVGTQITAGAGSAIDGTYGRLTVNANGDYTYTLYTSSDTGAAATGYAALQAIAKGESQTDVFSYTLKDADGDFSNATVTVTVNGSNDTPVITVVDVTGAVTEDASVVADNPTTVTVESGAYVTDSGSVTFDDVDLSDTSTVTATLQITNYFDWAAISNNGGGNWPGTLSGRLYKATYDTQAGRTLTNAEFIALGYELMSQSNGTIGAFVVNFTDNTQTTIDYIVSKASVTGIVDRPAGTDPNNANTTVTGQRVYLNSADVASAQAILGRSATVSNPSSAVSALATALQLSGAGTGAAAHSGTVNWTFAVDNNQIQYLTGGESLVATYRLIVKDNSTTTPVTATDNHNVALRLVTVTIAGTNEAPVIDLDTANTNTFNRTATFDAGGSAVAFAAGVTNLTDADSTTFDKLTLSWTAANFPDGSAERLLVSGATAGGTIAGLANLAGSGSITLASSATVDYSVSTASGVVSVVFTGASGAELTQAHAEELIDALRYENSSAQPTTGSARVFSLQPTDGEATTGNTATFGVTVAIPSTLSIDDVTVNEAAGNAVFTVTRGGTNTATAVTVAYTTSSGTAATGGDFTATSGTLTFASGVTTQQIVVPIVNDGVYEGSETFNVTLSSPSAATITDGTGLGTIKDDGTGNGGSDDDRPTLSVTGVSVEEGSRATFTVTRSGATEAATLIDLALSNVDTESGDFDATTYEWSTNGTTWTPVTGNQISLAGNTNTFYVRVATTADAVFEGAEAFKLTASFNAAALKFADGVSGTTRTGYTANANSTIYDDGSIDGDDGSDSDTTTVKDDDRPTLSVTGVSVEEGSRATFTVTRSGATEAATLIDLALSNVDTESGDFDATTYEWSTNGTTWTPVTGNQISLAGNTNTFYVRVATTADAVFEGAEAFKLTASFNAAALKFADGVSGTTRTGYTANANSTIYDDGSIDGDDGSDSDTTTVKDDDRPTLSVTGVSVEEGSRATFTVTRSGATEAATLIDLALSNVDTESGDFDATTYEWSTNGTTWTPVTGNQISLAGNTNTFYVRVATTADAVFEGAEAFKLTASFNAAALKFADGVSGTTRTGYTANANSTIYDDGSIDGDDGSDSDTTTVKDDDRPTLSVTGVSVEEGSRATFTVTRSGATEAATLIDLALSNVDTESGDFDATTYEWSTNGTTWTPVTGNQISLAGNTNTFYVRVATTADAVFEGAEAFKLTASFNAAALKFADGVSGTTRTGYTANANSTIYDDGSIDGDDGSDSDTSTVKDDDRPTLSVTGVSVEEGSRATFTVTRSGATEAATLIDLALSNVDTESGDFDATTYEWSTNGTTWTPVTGNQVSLAGNTNTFYVRVATTADAVFEGAEAFKLTASFNAAALKFADGVSGTTRTGYTANANSTIYDDGSIDGDDGSDSNTTTVKDDDRTAFSIGDVSISEGGLMTFTVTRSGDAEASQSVDFATSIAGGDSAESGDFTAASGTLTFAPGVSSQTFTVQTAIDAIYEGAETFTVTLSNNATGSTISDASAVGTIVDDGSGPGPDGDGPLTPDDDRSITVTGLDDVSEGSNAIFTVQLEGPSSAPTVIDLALGGSGDSAEPEDYSPNFTAYYYDDNGDQQPLTITAGKITLPSGVTRFYVSVPTVDDLELERAESLTLTATIVGGKSGRDQSTILDDGTGKIYDAKGENPTGPGDDDTPVPPAKPKVDPAPPETPVEVVEVVSPRAPVEFKLPAVDAVAVADIVTSSSGFPITVVEGSQPTLVVFNGITDQFVEARGVQTVQLPADAFAHTRAEAVITLIAQLSDGSPLPPNILFNSQAGTFQVTPRPGIFEELEITVIARDAEGREAATKFKLNIGEAAKPTSSLSRPALTELLRNASVKQRDGAFSKFLQDLQAGQGKAGVLERSLGADKLAAPTREVNLKATGDVRVSGMMRGDAGGRLITKS